MLTKIRSLLARFSRRKRRFDFPTLEFAPVDANEVAKHLGLASDGRANGEKNHPPTNAQQLDGPQAGVIQFINSEVADIAAAYHVRLLGFNEQIASVDIESLDRETRQLKGSYQTATEDLVKELRPRLVQAHRDYRSADKRLQEFKLRHGLQREANYPASLLLLWAVLIAALVFEGGMNAYFFEQGSRFGLSGGAATALILAGVDVFVVYWLGRCAAWMLERRWPHRGIGGLAGGIFVFWVVGYNLLVSHIREQLQLDPTQAGEAALDAFLANPIALTQADSWILFAVGVVFSSLAMWSGWSWTDPYPGFGAAQRARDLAREDYEEERTEQVQELSALRDDYLEELDGIRRDGDAALLSLRNAIKTKDTLLKNVRIFIAHYTDSCNALIQGYRDENLKARTTAAPSYFNDYASIEVPYDFPEDVGEDHAKLEAQVIARDQLLTHTEEARDAIIATFESVLSEVEDEGFNPDRITPSGSTTTQADQWEEGK